MTTQTETAKEKQVPDLYLFETMAVGEKSGKFAGTASRLSPGRRKRPNRLRFNPPFNRKQPQPRGAERL